MAAICERISAHGIFPAALLALIATSSLANASDLQFNRDIRPILSENCFACHGPDAAHRKADLRLDDRDAAIAARAIVPGQADQSLIIDRILSNDPDVVMPPPDSHKTLSADQKETLRQWINDGAIYQKHWSYEPPRKPDVPADVHPIDFLVQQRLQVVGLKQSPAADRRTLARRLSFDLLGLPPTPESVAAFSADVSSKAYEDFVAELLASPHFGERMALGWLDVVRFADTIGYHSDNPRNIWPYRDWVIQSFNDNKPFDRFTLEQIAGICCRMQTRRLESARRLIDFCSQPKKEAHSRRIMNHAC